jgi:hypothetical protein
MIISSSSFASSTPILKYRYKWFANAAFEFFGEGFFFGFSPFYSILFFGEKFLVL